MMTMQKTMLLVLFLLLQLTIHHTSTEVPPHRHHRRHLPTADSESPHKFSVEQRKALQQVIRTMMGFGKDEVPPPHAAGLLRQTDGGGSSGGAHPSSSSGGGQVAPRYMHRLYEKYRIAETEGGTKGMADTVRNMNAELVICNNGTLFAFNLTSIAESESVLRAEIHIYKRRRPKVSSHSNESSTAELPQPSSPEPPGFIVIKAYELGPGVLRERTSFRLPDAGHSGWTIFDVTSAVKDCASTMRSGNTTHMLALGFSLDDDDTDGRSRSRSSTGKLLTLSTFVRKLSKPFLMVFSQENRSNYLDAQLDVLSQRSGEDRPSDKPGAIDEDSWRWVYDNPILLHHDRSLASRRKSRLLPPAFRSRVMWSSPSEVRGSKRRNLSDEIFAMESPPSGPDLIWNTTGRVFQKFAVEEEAIGGLFRRRFYHAGFEPDPLYPPLHPPNIVPAARNLRDRRRKRHVVADNEIPQDVAFPDPDPVPFVYYNLPKTNPGILRGRSEQQPGKKKKEQQSTPRPADIAFGSAAHDDEEEKGPRQRRRGTKGRLLSAVVPGRHRGRGGGRRRNGAREEEEEEEVCGKRKLVVDFADIGWREWIISPRSFEAHYCDGLCSYPMAPRLRPTNHATIQSIVKAIGLQTDVPSPCCIPASLSSVTLLYFDQNQNVVLKNYPDMTVRSCACR